jgi:hypothetical protein
MSPKRRAAYEKRDMRYYRTAVTSLQEGVLSLGLSRVSSGEFQTFLELESRYLSPKRRAAYEQRYIVAQKTSNIKYVIICLFRSLTVSIAFGRRLKPTTPITDSALSCLMSRKKAHIVTL